MSRTTNNDLAPVRAYWNTLAMQAPDGCRDHWVDANGCPLPEDLYEQVAEYVMHNLPKNLDSKPSTLEIGCGTGRILAALECRLPSANLWGIDVAEEQIRDAHTRLKSVNLESKDLLTFVEGVSVQMIGKFDLVFAHSVTQYFPSKDYFFDVLREATKLLRSGGVLCLIDVPVDWYYEQMRGQPKRTILTPIKILIKRILRYKPRPPVEASSAIENFNCKNIEVPVFKGYWASPEAIESFANHMYSDFSMEYQLFSAKPVDYRKYRPIFLMRGKLEVCHK